MACTTQHAPLGDRAGRTLLLFSFRISVLFFSVDVSIDSPSAGDVAFPSRPVAARLFAHTNAFPRSPAYASPDRQQVALVTAKIRQTVSLRNNFFCVLLSLGSAKKRVVRFRRTLLCFLFFVITQRRNVPTAEIVFPSGTAAPYVCIPCLPIPSTCTATLWCP